MRNSTADFLKSIQTDIDEFVEKAMNGYPTEMEAAKKDANTPITKAELVKLEGELTAALEAAVGYSERAEIADKAKEKTFKLQNIFNADVRADIHTGSLFSGQAENRACRLYA